MLSVEGGATAADIFFIYGGRRRIAGLELESVPAASNETRRILDLAGAVNWQKAKHSLYVIELRPQVFNEQRFLEKNLAYIPGVRPCVYVGLTGKTPEERLRDHWRGVKSAYYVTKYGLDLCRPLYEHLNPLPYELAKEMEGELARHLRSQGYGVWQN